MSFIALMAEGISYVTKYPAARIMLLCADKNKHEYVKKAAAVSGRFFAFR